MDFIDLLLCWQKVTPFFLLSPKFPTHNKHPLLAYVRPSLFFVLPLLINSCLDQARRDKDFLRRLLRTFWTKNGSFSTILCLVSSLKHCDYLTI